MKVSFKRPSFRNPGSIPHKNRERILAPHGYLKVLICEMGIMSFEVLRNTGGKAPEK